MCVGEQEAPNEMGFVTYNKSLPTDTAIQPKQILNASANDDR